MGRFKPETTDRSGLVGRPAGGAARQPARPPRLPRPKPSLVLENEARRRPVGEQSTSAVCDPSLSGADAATTIQDLALGLDRAGIGGDGTQQRNLELKRGLSNARIQCRLDSKAHATIK